jgi:hypothetical protein
MLLRDINDYLAIDGFRDSDIPDRVHAQFPHVVVVEGDFPEFDIAVRWRFMGSVGTGRSILPVRSHWQPNIWCDEKFVENSTS